MSVAQLVGTEYLLVRLPPMGPDREEAMKGANPLSGLR